MDSAHFVLSAFLGTLWCFKRLFLKSPSGRQRYNVLGALDAITHEVVTVCNDAYINSQSVCELLEKLRERHPVRPIRVVLDNARYQRCRLVIETAQELDIVLVFLPPYSPNLNLIERMWKFTKKKCLYSQYYSDFADFKAAIYDCVVNGHLNHKEELERLLTLRFQTFDLTQVVTV